MGRTLRQLKLYDRAEEFLASCVAPEKSASRGAPATSIDAISELKQMFRSLPKI